MVSTKISVCVCVKINEESKYGFDCEWMKSDGLDCRIM